MKKVAFTALLGLLSTAAFAAPVGSTFTGFGAGVDLTTTKYKHAKRATGVGVVVDYGFDYGNDLVGLVEGKVKLNRSKLADETIGGVHYKADEKFRASVAYLQGYRVLPDLLPYVKVAYTVTKFDASEKSANYTSTVSATKSGYGLGVGVKYAVSSNFELGAEYLGTRTKFEHGSVKGNTLGANATYRF